MAEVLFYHLLKRPLEAVLPDLLERTLQRGWKAVVKTGQPERLKDLDRDLWTYADDSFLPHGLAADSNADLQPILLSDSEARPNDADVLFLIEGAGVDDAAPFVRVVDLFNGHDELDVQAARERFKQAKQAGHDVTYWQENEQGRFEKKA